MESILLIAVGSVSALLQERPSPSSSLPGPSVFACFARRPGANRYFARQSVCERQCNLKESRLISLDSALLNLCLSVCQSVCLSVCDNLYRFLMPLEIMLSKRCMYICLSQFFYRFVMPSAITLLLKRCLSVCHNFTVASCLLR